MGTWDPLAGTTSRRVAVVFDREATTYVADPPFHPSSRFPELPFQEVQERTNWAYELVRRLFRDLALDASHYNSADWNPLGEFVKPGDTVVLKPNFVAHRNWGSSLGLTDTTGLITHGSVIRAVADFVFIALGGRGKVLLGDCPVQATDWSQVCELAGIPWIQRFYREHGLDFETRDFRLVVARMEREDLIRAQKSQNSLDDYIEVDLGADSLLMPIIHDASRFAVSGYGFGRMRRAHNETRNAYLFPRELLSADCFINLPKLKFHQKAGITCALKNLVGINGHKDYLPHFRMGIDEYPPGLGAAYRLFWTIEHLGWSQSNLVTRRLLRQLARLSRLLFRKELIAVGQGAWPGNDTLWRTVLDINRGFLYYSVPEGKLTEKQQRKYFAIVDGIIGGEGESPLSPSPVVSSCVMGGANPAAIDVVAAALMSLDANEIPQVRNAFAEMRFPLARFSPAEVEILQNGERLSYQTFCDGGISIPFAPSAGWIGKVERDHVRRRKKTPGATRPAFNPSSIEAGQQGILE